TMNRNEVFDPGIQCTLLVPHWRDVSRIPRYWDRVAGVGAACTARSRGLGSDGRVGDRYLFVHGFGKPFVLRASGGSSWPETRLLDGLAELRSFGRSLSAAAGPCRRVSRPDSARVRGSLSLYRGGSLGRGSGRNPSQRS